ncbi:proton channel OTOP3 isoform X3 [Sphaerodactylus townsendi]|uniref:proton channel OTOP3 isoform X3 n=1 Tax=Sphaerodactylus townsendi TaxID=933632 RepID=UPI002026E9A2|nr:proton channel OTOP3 isoform X3 [Sphaerodactylus townsendi]
MWQRRHPQEAGGDQPEIATQPEAWKIRYEKSWLHRHCSSVLRRDKQAQKAGQLFSGLLAMNVVFLGSAFICSMIFNKVAITLGDVWIFLSILKIVALGWIAYYLLFTRRKPHAILYRDAHAGPVWVKGNMTSSCRCPNTTVCKIFQKGYILLYPFNTEYCLISCSMLYVMWKNVGRRITQHPAAHSKPKFKIRGLIFGPLLGISAVIIGICIFMLYQIQATSSSPSYHVFVLYYSYYLILLPLMAVGALTGTIIHGLEERELDTLKNPTRSLDVILLMGAALGQIGISYFSIVAIVATNPTGLLNSIILAYSVCLIIQHITQNIFIIEGLHRQPLVVDKASSYNPHAMQGSTSTQSPPNDHPITLRSSQESDPSMANKEVETKEGEKCEDGSSKAYGLEIRQEIRRASQAYVQNWKRKALQEISSFLIMCNIILWIMPSFGAHPEFENGLEKSFYGYSTWFAIVNFGLPLGVFYRMHSVGDLMEVYRSV